MKPFYLIWMVVNADNAFEPVLDSGRWETKEEVITYAQGLALIFSGTPPYTIFEDTEDVLATTP